MTRKYKSGSFCEGRNITFNLIMCEDKIVLLVILKSYVLHWYYAYLIHTGMNRMGANICGHFYRPRIR